MPVIKKKEFIQKYLSLVETILNREITETENFEFDYIQDAKEIIQRHTRRMSHI